MQKRLEMLMREAEKDPYKGKPYKEPSIADIKEHDWIGLRLLSLLLSADASNTMISDVMRSASHYQFKYSREVVLEAFQLINRERTEGGEWDNAESKLVRELNKTMKATDNGFLI